MQAIARYSHLIHTKKFCLAASLLFECLINCSKPECHGMGSGIRMVKLAGVDVAGPPSSGLHLGCVSDTYLSSLQCICKRERSREREYVLLQWNPSIVDTLQTW